MMTEQKKNILKQMVVLLIAIAAIVIYGFFRHSALTE
jgi:hypothetical protein